MNKITEWGGYDPVKKIYIFKTDGVWLPAFVTVVASNEHLARSLMCIHVNDLDDGTQSSFGKGLPELIAELPIDKTCAVTIWNGDY